MSRSESSVQASARPATRAVLRLAQPRLRRFLPGLAAGVLSAALAVSLLAVSAWLITRAAEMPPILFLSLGVVGVRAFALGRSVFRYLERVASHDAAFGQLADLRVGIFARLVPLAPAGLGQTRRGDLLSRLVRDVDALQDLPLRVVQPLLVSGITAALSVVGVWMILPAAGLGLLVSLVLAGLIGTLMSSVLAARAERTLAPLHGALSTEVLEILDNLDVLTAFGALDARLEKFGRVDDRLRRASLQSALGAGLQSAVVSLCAGAATIAALIWGIPALGTDGALTAPAFVVIVLVPLAVFEVFGMIPLAVGAFRQVHSSAERVATVVPSEVPREIPREHPVEHPVDRTDGSTSPHLDRSLPVVLELTNVGVRWPGGVSPAVSGVTLRLAPGDRVHLGGASGAGKTTLANALVRFLDYTGSYRLGGIEASDLPQSEVRGVVGLCEQRPWLFDDSIRQNLLFAKDTATDAELESMLARVGLLDWARARGGLDARVGERGALVSGGQAQRIALARALLADFPILIIDEPTANVDAEQGERLIHDILTVAADAHRAVLLISHTPVPAELITSRVMLH
ncbi:thiol reductant ABC exporter subunit CydC [Cryobacterium sp. CG_9.6]|uniref:thiol reductant ABC exporter subunit CydC n=1 Tax=Cryobacterium sp. CG_9.6 TaxID=2760710 RepID=UPI0024736EB2|nr:thiol reductant ABC exporter subunit CydC [Cryobacterium sp. CG_9.6]MDH6237193.1 ATP-binding cassette subfamily C protein CydC [Cryobacterium sp. CG_9.6]